MGGLFLPGDGYGTGGRAVLRHGDDAYRFVRWGDEAANGARLLDNGDDLARHADDAEQIRVVDEVVDGLCSFSPDTPVATADGPRPIVELQVGDLVLASHEGLRATGYYTVTAVWAHPDPVILHVTLGGETIEATPEHPFFVLLRGWVPAAELRVGDAVRRADGSYGRVADVAVVQRAQTMYNLTVAGAHTFFVGDQGWLVHNVCWRKYNPTQKHKPGGWETEIDLSDEVAEGVLNQDILEGKQVYRYYNGKLYEFQPDNVGEYHGYPIPGTEAPSSVLRELLNNGTITKAEYNRLRKGK